MVQCEVSAFISGRPGIQKFEDLIHISIGISIIVVVREGA